MLPFGGWLVPPVPAPPPGRGPPLKARRAPPPDGLLGDPPRPAPTPVVSGLEGTVEPPSAEPPLAEGGEVAFGPPRSFPRPAPDAGSGLAALGLPLMGAPVVRRWSSVRAARGCGDSDAWAPARRSSA